MAIVKKKLVKSIVKFRLPSVASDIECSDGEVASFRNIDWLSDAISSENSGLDSGSSASSGKPSASSVKLRIATAPTSVTLPPGSRLLTIHSPENRHGEKRYVFLASTDALGIYSPESGIKYLQATTVRNIGEICNVLQHGNIIMIIGSVSTEYIVYNPKKDEYLLTSIPPKAPTVTFSATPAHVEHYTQMAGTMPLLSASLDLKLADIGSINSLSNWLDAGHSTSVTEDVRNKIYKSVGDVVAKYIAEMTAAGYLLTPTFGIATLDDVLPSTAALIDTGYRPPYAQLQSWNYNAEILTLNFYFSLLPYKVTAEFERREEDKIWDSQFSEIQFHLSNQAQWLYNPAESLKATGYTSFTDPATGNRNGFAFRFSALSADELHRKMTEDATPKYCTAGKTLIGDINVGNVAIRGNNSPGSVFNPNYDDNTVANCSAGVAIDSGIIVWGGNATRINSAGNSESFSLDKSILVSHPRYPMIFRHRCHINEGRITGVMQGNGSRSTGDAGRHPLYVISTDGIRRLTADGNGGYMNTSLVTHEGSCIDAFTAQSAERIYYTTPFGLRSLGLDGSRKRITDNPPATDWEEMKILRDSETILLRKAGKCLLISSSDGQQFDVSDISVRPLCESEGQLYMTANEGNILMLSTEKYISAEDSGNRDTAETHSEAQFREQTDGMMSVTTRPLKLGSAVSEKAIWSIRTLSTDITLRLEGSEDLQNWEMIAEFRGEISSLRGCPYRFFRLSLTAPSSINSDLLRLVEICLISS